MNELSTMSAQYDWKKFGCRSCGACCRHYQIIDVADDDPNLEFLQSNNLLAENSETGAYAMKLQPEGIRRCAALTGRIGVDAACSIYEQRPQVCRAYESESHRCRTARYVQITRELGVELPKSSPNAARSKFIEQWLAAS